MSVKIRLKRMGSKKRPCYRLVIADSRSPRDGFSVEEVGYYHPVQGEDKQVSLKTERIRYWLEKGVQPSDTVKRILNKNKIYIGQV